MNGTPQTSYGYTGEPTDGNNLVHLRRRYLSPALGQFVSLDPLEVFNRYAYVSANPVNRVDPSGLLMAGFGSGSGSGVGVTIPKTTTPTNPVVSAAATGAVIGNLIGGLLGGKVGSVVGAVVGAAIGAVVGTVANNPQPATLHTVIAATPTLSVGTTSPQTTQSQNSTASTTTSSNSSSSGGATGRSRQEESRNRNMSQQARKCGCYSLQYLVSLYQQGQLPECSCPANAIFGCDEQGVPIQAVAIGTNHPNNEAIDLIPITAYEQGESLNQYPGNRSWDTDSARNQYTTVRVVAGGRVIELPSIPPRDPNTDVKIVTNQKAPNRNDNAVLCYEYKHIVPDRSIFEAGTIKGGEELGYINNFNNDQGNPGADAGDISHVHVAVYPCDPSTGNASGPDLNPSRYIGYLS